MKTHVRDAIDGAVRPDRRTLLKRGNGIIRRLRVHDTVRPRFTDAMLNAITAPQLHNQGMVWTGESKAALFGDLEELSRRFARMDADDQRETARVMRDIGESPFALGNVLTPESTGKADIGMLWTGLARQIELLKRVLDYADGDIPDPNTAAGRREQLNEMGNRIDPKTGRVLTSGEFSATDRRFVDNGSIAPSIASIQARFDAYNAEQARKVDGGAPGTLDRAVQEARDATEQARAETFSTMQRMARRANAWLNRL